MTYGPIDFIALEFQGNRFRGDILNELLDLVAKNVIRIIDLVVVLKDEDGEVEVLELQQLDPEVLALFDPLEVDVTSLLTEADIADLADQLDYGTTAGLLMIENLWAVRTMEAMIEANGRLLMFERIPHEVVVEALAEIAVIATSE
jgi:hypothetical protein